jgi:hypothetical protein
MTETAIQPTSPLSVPSHAGEHNRLNTESTNQQAAITALQVAQAAVLPQIQMARLAAHEWIVRGPVQSGVNLLLPILWNLTGNNVDYNAAKATVFTPPQGQSIKIDIVTGTVLAGGTYDLASMTTILRAPLEIPAGQYVSASYSAAAGDFVGAMGTGSFVAAYIQQVGVDPNPGMDLSIQLNRLL